MALAVAATALSKRYRGASQPAVDAIDLAIPKGILFGFLGPNGAGKTTLMDMIRGALPPSGGQLRVLDHQIPGGERHLKAQLGVVPQEDNLDPDFTARMNLLVYARYFGISPRAAAPKCDQLLQFVGLESKAGSGIDALSGGMKRRLVLARALVNDPLLLVLDEPTTGLDPQARHLVWDTVRQLRRRGITILLTTHYMEEAERLCDELVIMDHGNILAQGSPGDLVKAHAGSDVVEATFDGPVPIDGAPFVRAVDAGARVEPAGERVLIYTNDAAAVASDIRRSYPDVTVVLRPAGLEDVFLRLAGRALHP